MRNKYRVSCTFALLCALILTLSAPCGLLISSAAAESGVNGDLDWTLEAGVLTITGNGVVDDGIYSAPWGVHAENITAVVLGEGITSVGAYVFSSYNSITKVTLPCTIENIDGFAFAWCQNLSEINFPEGLKSIGKGAFYECTALRSVILPSSLESLGSTAFVKCELLESITVSADNKAFVSVDGVLFNKDMTLLIEYPPAKTGDSYIVPASVTTLEPYSFMYCDIKNITLPAGLTDIGHDAFSDSTELVSVDFGGAVNIAGWAFFDCDSLTRIVIPDSVKNIGKAAFGSCSSLESIYIGAGTEVLSSDFAKNCPKLTAVEVNEHNARYMSENGVLYNKEQTGLICYPTGKSEALFTFPATVTYTSPAAFYMNTLLTEVHLSDGITAISSELFKECTALKTVVFGSKLQRIGKSAFEKCAALTEIELPDSVTAIENKAFQRCSTLASVRLGASVTELGDGAFAFCQALTSITLPDKITMLNNSLFYGSGLTSITIPSAVTAIGQSVFGSTKLTSVTVPEGVTSIGRNAFINCAELNDITLPDSLTSIGAMAFNGTAYALDPSNTVDGALYIGNRLISFNTSGSVTVKDGTLGIADSAFQGAITTIALPDSLTSISRAAFIELADLTAFSVREGNRSYTAVDGVLFSKDKTVLTAYPVSRADSSYIIPDGVTKIADYAFYDNRFVASLVFPASLQTIGDYAFGSCRMLTAAELNDGLAQLGICAFSGCRKLQRAVLPGTLKTVSDYAFNECFSLAELTIGDGVESIGEYAFYYCSQLKNITIPSSIKELGNNAFGITGYSNDEKNWQDGLLKLDGYLLGTGYGQTDFVLGEDITVITDSAFYYNDTVLSVTIPGSVERIPRATFPMCDALSKVVISEGVRIIEGWAFEACPALTDISLPSTLVSIGEDAFTETALGTNLCNYTDGVLYIDGYAVLAYGVSGKLTLADGTLGIADGLFKNCVGLTSVTLPDSLRFIGSEAFAGCGAELSYNGTATEWKKISLAADFDRDVNYMVAEYTVTWSVNGVETHEIYAAGEMPVFKGSTDKAADAENSYEFTGWSPELSAAEKDVTYTAQYKNIKISKTADYDPTLTVIIIAAAVLLVGVVATALILNKRRKAQ